MNYQVTFKRKIFEKSLKLFKKCSKQKSLSKNLIGLEEQENAFDVSKQMIFLHVGRLSHFHKRSGKVYMSDVTLKRTNVMTFDTKILAVSFPPTCRHTLYRDEKSWVISIH